MIEFSRFYYTYSSIHKCTPMYRVASDIVNLITQFSVPHFVEYLETNKIHHYYICPDKLSILSFIHLYSKDTSCADPEGMGRGSGPPSLKNHTNIGFLSNTGLDPLKNHKVTKQSFNVVRSSALHQWRFAGEPMMAPF